MAPSRVIDWRRAHALLAICDQGVVSVANFVAAAIVGRRCAQDELGAYALGVLVVVLLTGIPRALVWTPYTTYLPRWSPGRQRRYSGSAMVHVAALGLIGSAALLVASQVGGAWHGTPHATWIPLCLAPVLLLVLAREHARRTCLAWKSTGEVLLLDLSVSLLQLALLAALDYSGRLTAVTGLLAWGGGCLASIVWYAARTDRFQFRLRAVRAHAGRNWQMARWLLLGAVAALATASYYRFALSSLHGLAAMGILASAQSLSMIANPVVLGIGNYLTPAMAAQYLRGGAGAMTTTALRSTLLLAAVWSGLLSMLWLGGGEAVELVFGDKYRGIGWEVFVLGLGFCSESLFTPVEAALTAAGRARQTYLAALARVLTALAAGSYLIAQHGVTGVGYAMLAANLTVLAAEWAMFLSLRRRAAGERSSR